MGHPRSSYIFIALCLSPFGTRKIFVKFCSWAEQTSIWLKNDTITQSYFGLYIWPSTLILLNFNFFWKRDSLREEKILQKILLAQWVKLIGFSYLLHVHQQMKTWAGTGSLLGLIQDYLPSFPFKEIPKYLNYSFITCIVHKKRIKLVINW